MPLDADELRRHLERADRIRLGLRRATRELREPDGRDVGPAGRARARTRDGRRAVPRPALLPDDGSLDARPGPTPVCHDPRRVGSDAARMTEQPGPGGDTADPRVEGLAVDLAARICGDDRASLVAEVESRLAELPADCQALWSRARRRSSARDVSERLSRRRPSLPARARGTSRARSHRVRRQSSRPARAP